MSARPTVIRVAGRDWAVQSTDLSAQGCVGLCSPAEGVLHIHPGQTRHEEQDTVLHETMHAILRSQGRGYSAAEERYVTALATGLLGVLHDNPALHRYLTTKR
jgi:hypothetical protein